MSFGLFDWFLGLFNKDNTLNIDMQVGSIQSEILYQKFALNSAVTLISSAVSRGEFLTYELGKEVIKQNYYLLNIEANQNQSSNAFWREVVVKMLIKGECLVVQVNGKFYIAEDYQRNVRALTENIYTDVVIGDYSLKDVFYESDVFFFEYSNTGVKELLENICAMHSKLIAISKKRFKRNKNVKGTLDVPTNYPQTDKAQEQLQDLMNNKFKKYFDPEVDAVLPLQNGVKYIEGKGESSSNESREIRALIDDIFDFTAIALQISPSLLKGNIADNSDAVNNLLTFRVKPIAENITEEINRKWYGKKLYLERTYCKLDTSRIKAVDIKSIASSLDILTRIGANSVNDSLRILGRETINEPWADERFMTKNYELISKFVDKKVKGDGKTSRKSSD